MSLAGIAVACSLAGDMAMYTVLPVIYLDIGMTALQVGVVLAANRFIRFFTNPLSHYLTRRYPARLLLNGALITGAAIAFLYGTMPPYAALIALRLLWGLCWSVLRQIGIMNASGKALHNRAARMTGIYNGIVRAGFLAGTLLAGFLVDSTEYRIMFAILAAFMAVGTVPATLAFSRREIVAAARSGHREAEKQPEKASLAPRSVFQAIKGFVAGSVGSGIVMSTLGYVLKTDVGTTISIGNIVIGVASLNGILLASRHLVGIAGGPAVGVALDRIGVMRGEAIAFVGCFLSLSAAFIAPKTLMIAIAILSFSIFETTAFIALTTEASRTGRGYTLFATASDMGAAVGPMLAWTLIETVRLERIGFAIGALLYLSAFYLVFIANRKRS